MCMTCIVYGRNNLPYFTVFLILSVDGYDFRFNESVYYEADEKYSVVSTDYTLTSCHILPFSLWTTNIRLKLRKSFYFQGKKNSINKVTLHSFWIGCHTIDPQLPSTQAPYCQNLPSTKISTNVQNSSSNIQ